MDVLPLALALLAAIGLAAVLAGAESRDDFTDSTASRIHGR